MSEMLDIEELREAIRSVLKDRGGDAIEIPGEAGRGLDRALWREMADLGWLGLGISEAHGGLGLGVSHLAVLYEELGRDLASVPALQTMLAASAIAAHGDTDMQARHLPVIATGDCLAAVALPGETALPQLSGDRVSGMVDHVAFADVATLLLIPIKMAEGIGLVVLPADTKGVSVTQRPVVDLTRSVGRVTLDNVAVDPAAILRLDTKAWDALIDHAAMGLACDAIGGAAALLDITVDYLKIREQFGRPIGSFQALKHRAADWKVKIEAISALTRHAAALADAGGEGASAMASNAKAYACDTYAAFCGDAIQLHGGIGFTWEHPCHLFLKRAKLSQQLFGSSTAHKERVARLAFDAAVADAPVSEPLPQLQTA